MTRNIKTREEEDRAEEEAMDRVADWIAHQEFLDLRECHEDGDPLPLEEEDRATE